MPKALLRLPEGDTFLERVVRLAAGAGADPVVVVTGAHPLVAPPPARAIHNPDWALGQLSSLRVGLAAVALTSFDGALVALADHPLVRPETFVALVETFARTGAPVVRPVHAGRRGHPVVFAACLFDELRRAELEAGARPVVARHEGHAVDVQVDDPGVVTDLDTREDLDAAGIGIVA